MLQAIGYLMCALLWVVGALVTIIKKNPFYIILLAFLHGAEAVVIGVKTGLTYGKKFAYSVVMCLTFGFTWWLPLKRQIDAEQFTDADFVRTPNDVNVTGK